MRYLFGLYLLLSLAACSRQDVATAAVDLDALRGQWVVINYWAQWCKPCIKEIPELNTLDRNYDQVTVLGVNYDGIEGAELEQQRQALGVEFASISDPAAQLGTPRPVVLPATLILNPQGEVVETLLGPQTLESLAQATGQSVAAPVQ